MIIVGVGCGPDMLTMQAAKVIYNAKRIAGSERALALAEEFIPEDCRIYVLRDYFKLEEFPEDTVVLSTGDPMLAGLRAEGAEYMPGISSLQVAFARLRLPLESVSIVSAHGKNHHAKALTDAVKEAKRGKNVFLLADPAFDLPALAKALLDKEIDCRLAVCQDLGYEEESIEVGTPASPPPVSSKMFAVIIGKW